MNFLIITFYFSVRVKFFFKFSGRIPKTNKHKKKFKEIKHLCFIGMIGRIIQAVISFLIIGER